MSSSPSSSPSAAARPRAEFRNIHALKDLPSYRLPAAGWVSILHRISGALMFLLLPLVVWLFDKSLTSELSFAEFQAAFSRGLWVFPAWFVKLVVVGLVWAYLHHFIAGLRHLRMDAFHAVSKEQGKNTAVITLVLAPALTLAVALKLFGVF